MTDDRRRSDDVYKLVEGLSDRVDQMGELRMTMGGDAEILARVREHEQMMLILPEIEMTVGVLADAVIGKKRPDPLRPGKFLINGNGQPLRDESTGLVQLKAKLSRRQVLFVTVGQATFLVTAMTILLQLYR